MDYKKIFQIIIIFLCVLSFSTGCRNPNDACQTESSSNTHRIGIRGINGDGKFYDLVCGTQFIPRGNNYVRLANQITPNGQTIFHHSTFNVGLYDASLAEDTLQNMHNAGYNVVRVFLNGNCKNGCIGDPDGGLSKYYISNVVDFLQKAKKYDIYVILTADSGPNTPYYNDILNTSWSENFEGTNFNYLTSGGVLVAQHFWGDFIEGLRAQNAPMDAIFAFEIGNEFFFEVNADPLALTSGIVQTANGKSYDMSSEEEKHQMMDENLVYWLDQVREVILELDPTALVTAGFFPPDEPNPYPLDGRYISTYAILWESQLDFIDFHPYPGGYSLDKLVENLGMAGMRKKPIIMGEFGAFRSLFATDAEAAQALHDWQVDSCNYGFDGWLLWTWDTDEQPELFNAIGGDGFINQVLAPINRPYPCVARNFDFFVENLAIGMSVTATRSAPENPASNVVDGRLDQWWVAAANAPQWIQIDMGNPTTIGLIRLVTVQSPQGITKHQLWVGSTTENLYLLHTFQGNTTDGQVLDYEPVNPIENVRYIRVVTMESPSWVGWKEIEILAP